MFENEYLLDVDIKFKYTGRTPVFRRGDTSILKFRVHNNSVLYNLAPMTEAEMTIIMPSGFTLRDRCKKIVENGQTLVEFQFLPVHMIEIGFYNIILTMTDSEGVISVQPIVVNFFDNLNETDTTILDLIQDLQSKINEMQNSILDTIKLSEKGVADGVATLDNNTKIPHEQIPDNINNHLKEVMYLTGAHGFRINNKGQAQYLIPTGQYQNAGFAPYASEGVSRLILDLSINQSVVTLAYSGIGNMATQKWEQGNRGISYFQTQGKSFNGSTVTVSDIGMYSFYYTDEEGNEYLKKMTVVKSDIAPPEVSIYKEFGVVALMYDGEFQLQKYDVEVRDLDYFQINGKMIVGNSFRLTVAGTYTVYYKLMNGLDYVQTFEMLESDLDPDT